MEFIGKTKDKVKVKIQDEITSILPDGESVEKVYVFVEDFFAFTEKRALLIDKKLLGSKKTLTSIPYSKINFVSLKMSGFLGISKEVLIGTSGAVLEIDTFDAEQANTIVKEISSRIA